MDIAILDWMQMHRSPILDTLVPMITKLGDAGLVWIVIFGVLCIHKKTRMIGFMGFLALILEVVLVSGILKPIVMRDRPFIAYPLEILIRPPMGSSFPSGHAASSFAAATILFLYKVKGKWWYGVGALLIALSRLYLYVHYPSDVLVGSVIGIVVGVWVYRNRTWIESKVHKIKQRKVL